MRWIWNARLEVGESLDHLNRVKTDTKLFHLKLKDGKIEKIIEASAMSPLSEGYDANGQLLLPAFKEMHNHLDKTYFSEPWKACVPAKDLEQRLELEADELVALSKTVEKRASTMIEHHINNGVNHIRTHVNIDPFIKLENFYGVKKALENYSDYITYEIVAFPQHGLLKHEEVPDLLREALSNGATILGGLDPAGIDKNIEESLQVTMAIAKEFQVDVDMHLHDRGQLGIYTMETWLDMIELQDFKQKTSFSHAFGIASLKGNTLNKFTQRLKEHDVQILTTAPIGLKSTLIPIQELQENDVFVGLGCDGFYDSWSPLVSGDIVDKAKDYAEYTGRTSEKALRETLGLITNNITPLDDKANQVWPKEGNEASFTLVNAASSAELIAQATDQNNRVLIHKGNLFQS